MCPKSCCTQHIERRVCVKLHAELQGGNKDRATMMNSLMPLEQALRAQTYLVQDTLSLADIVIAVDIKHMVSTSHHMSILIIFHAMLIGFICTLYQSSGTSASCAPAKHIHTSTHGYHTSRSLIALVFTPFSVAKYHWLLNPLPCVPKALWAAWYNNGLFIKLAPKRAVFPALPFLPKAQAACRLLAY